MDSGSGQARTFNAPDPKKKKRGTLRSLQCRGCAGLSGFFGRRLVQAKDELAADGHGAQFGVEAFAILNVALIVSPPSVCDEFAR
jgi:hypothetical protein